MHKGRMVVLTAALVIGGPIARAGERNENVQWLYETCNAAASSGDKKAVCLGALLGVAEGMADAGQICIQGSITAAALEQSFINWTGTNPSEWGLPGWKGEKAAFEKTWPCSSN